MSRLFTLTKSDFLKGLVMAIGSAILTALYTIFGQVGFNVFSADWHIVLGNVITVSLITTVTYFVKNLGTNNAGQILKPDVPS